MNSYIDTKVYIVGLYIRISISSKRRLGISSTHTPGVGGGVGQMTSEELLANRIARIILVANEIASSVISATKPSVNVVDCR